MGSSSVLKKRPQGSLCPCTSGQKSNASPACQQRPPLLEREANPSGKAAGGTEGEAVTELGTGSADPRADSVWALVSPSLPSREDASDGTRRRSCPAGGDDISVPVFAKGNRGDMCATKIQLGRWLDLNPDSARAGLLELDSPFVKTRVLPHFTV